MDQFEHIIKQQWPAFLADLQRIMQVPSVKGTATNNAPYGMGPKQALEQVLRLGRGYGFKTKMIDQKIGYVEWGTSDTDYIGVFGHLDVVAPGEGWSVPPFDLTEKAGNLYGRGILDNKGPIMCCLYGLKLLKELGVVPSTKIRIVFGTDEESGMSDIPAYLAAEPAPSFGFTPDCKYPVVYGERGILQVRLSFPLSTQDRLLLGTIEGDQSRAHVPDQLRVTVAERVVTAKGRRAPSNAPKLGENAITILAKKLQQEAGLSEAARTTCAWIAEKLHAQHTGEGIGLHAFSATEEASLVTPVILQKTTEGLSLDVSIRYPVARKEAQVLAAIRQHLPKQAEIEVVRSIPSICRDKESRGARLLSEVYGQVTGTYLAPVTTTGATYARKVPNILAFGPSFPGQKGIAHREDEYMAVADLQTNVNIYMHAMAALIKNENNKGTQEVLIGGENICGEQ